MKHLFLVLLLIVFASGCEKEDVIPIVREDLIGVWVNQSKEDDYLEFREWYTLIDRTAYPGAWENPHTYYNYELWNDTLKLLTSFIPGERNVLYKCKLEFLDSDMQVLNIKGLDTVPPYIEGVDFRRLE